MEYKGKGLAPGFMSFALLTHRLHTQGTRLPFGPGPRMLAANRSWSIFKWSWIVSAGSIIGGDVAIGTWKTSPARRRPGCGIPRGNGQIDGAVRVP